jgi:hypothetical protein
MLRRMILAPLVGAIALLLFAGPALAAPSVPNGTPFTVTIPAGELCPFEVTLEGRDGQVVRTTLPDGTEILTGPFVLTITNTAPGGRSETFNISGPTFTSGNQLVLTGTAIVLLFNEFAPPGPGIIATNGRGTIENMDFNLDTFTGRTRDVCQQLA